MKKDKINSYYVNRHSCFLLQYHLVLVTKYRHPVIVGDLEKSLIDYTKQYFEKQGLNIIEVNTCNDHIHILFEAPPQINLASFINIFKTASSKVMRSSHEEFLNQYSSETSFWSLSYFVGSVSERSVSAVQEYIQMQKG